MRLTWRMLTHCEIGTLPFVGVTTKLYPSFNPRLRHHRGH